MIAFPLLRVTSYSVRSLSTSPTHTLPSPYDFPIFSPSPYGKPSWSTRDILSPCCRGLCNRDKHSIISLSMKLFTESSRRFRSRCQCRRDKRFGGLSAEWVTTYWPWTISTVKRPMCKDAASACMLWAGPSTEAFRTSQGKVIGLCSGSTLPRHARICCPRCSSRIGSAWCGLIICHSKNIFVRLCGIRLLNRIPSKSTCSPW